MLSAEPKDLPQVIFAPTGVVLRFADGGILRISDIPGRSPAHWTPDGDAFVYRGTLDDGSNAIIVTPTDGSGPYVLTQDRWNRIELLGITPDGLVAYTLEFSCC